MMDLDPCRSSCVVEVVEEAHEASCMVKKPLEHLMGQMTHFVVIPSLTGSWYPRRRFGYAKADAMMDLDP